MTTQKTSENKPVEATKKVSAKSKAASNVKPLHDSVADQIDATAKHAKEHIEAGVAAIRDSVDIKPQDIAADAAAFVRRNPGVSVAAAMGIGALAALLLTKRS